MTDKHLHIVCLDVPYPTDYGGVYDLFFKIKALHAIGIRIHLHCFEYGRGHQDELDKYCQSVNYYKRKGLFSSFSLRLPFIVSSRKNPELLRNLLNDRFPVLLEGIHCTAYLYSGALAKNRIFVRLHNIEYEYYRQLSRATGQVLKKMYYLGESFLLRKFEKAIANPCMFFAVSKKDLETYQRDLGACNIEYLPVFVPDSPVSVEKGSGSFCLYHGNLSVPENEKAAVWLVKEVFRHLPIPLVIAGKNPSKRLMALAHNNGMICIVANPSSDEMNDLIKKAQIHVLPSLNSTGIKIKLLIALFGGRFILTNRAAVADNDLDSVCTVAETAADFKGKITELFHQPFDQESMAKRKQFLETTYNNTSNAQTLVKWIWKRYPTPYPSRS